VTSSGDELEVLAAVAVDEAGMRVDLWLATRLGISRTRAKALCDDLRVRAGAHALRKGEQVVAGAVIGVAWPSSTVPPPASSVSAPTVFVDDDLVVVDKPAGLPSHPRRDRPGPSALGAVGAGYPEVLTAGPEPLEGGLLHRLDNETSGLLAFARTHEAYERLSPAFRSRPRAAGRPGTESARKGYCALVEGIVAEPLRLDWPIAHHARDARRMVAVVHDDVRHRGAPRSAHTVVEPLASGEGATLVAVLIGAGARHQIRVHLAAAGHPLVGDTVYGALAADGLGGHALHAAWLALPGGREPIFAPPPASFATAAAARGIDVASLLPEVFARMARDG